MNLFNLKRRIPDSGKRRKRGGVVEKKVKEKQDGISKTEEPKEKTKIEKNFSFLSNNWKKILFFIFTVLFLLTSAYFADRCLEVKIFMRWWFFKMLLGYSILVISFFIKKALVGEKGTIIWGLANLIFVLAFTGWIWNSPDTKDFKDWRKIQVSSSSSRSKSWQTVFSHTYPGEGIVGKVFIPTAQSGKDYFQGDKIIVFGTKFRVYNGVWEDCQGRYEIIKRTPDSGKFFYIAAEDGVAVTVEVQRFMYPIEQDKLTNLSLNQ